MMEQVFYILDIALIVYIVIQILLYNILRTEWAENTWNKEGTGYTKRSTRPDKIKCLIKIAVCVVLLIASTLIQHYKFDYHHIIDPNHFFNLHGHGTETHIHVPAKGGDSNAH